MKTRGKISIIGAVVTFALTFMSTNAFANAIEIDIQNDINVKPANKSITLTPIDASTNLYETSKFGELLGPESVAFKSDGGVYLLDNLKEKVILYSKEGSIENIVDIKGLKIAKVAAAKDDTMMLLNAADGKIYINNRNKFDEYVIKNLRLELLSDFGVTNDNKPFVFLSDSDLGRTYVFDLQDNVANVSEIITGRLAAEGDIFTSELIVDKGLDVGHNCVVTIYKGTNSIKIPISSIHWISGAKYLGVQNGNYIIQTFEFENEKDNTAVSQNYIRTYDKNGKELNCIPVDENYKYIQNDVVLVDGTIKSINLKDSCISINELDSDVKKTDILKSMQSEPELQAMNGVNTTKVPAYASVKRSLIQTTVKSYWSCSWYCSQNNYIGATSGWTRPHYITNYNVQYQCIPYNWGGWDTHAGFLSKISNGKTAGNINTSNVFSGYAGVDCSGYVQRCWGINDAKKNTTMLDSASISQSVQASNLKFGDAWNSTGHIMIYEKLDAYGNYVLYEATLLNNYDRVAHTTRPVASVQSSHHSIRRLNIIEDV